MRRSLAGIGSHGGPIVGDEVVPSVALGPAPFGRSWARISMRKKAADHPSRSQAGLMTASWCLRTAAPAAAVRPPPCGFRLKQTLLRRRSLLQGVETRILGVKAPDQSLDLGLLLGDRLLLGDDLLVLLLELIQEHRVHLVVTD